MLAEWVQVESKSACEESRVLSDDRYLLPDRTQIDLRNVNTIDLDRAAT